MTLTVNGQPAVPGCVVDGHWGQYGPDHLADQIEAFDVTIPKEIDPRRYRRIADWVQDRSPDPLNGPLANVYLVAIDTGGYELEDFANELTEGGFWSWEDGECFLRSYVCQECGRDAQDGSMHNVSKTPGLIILNDVSPPCESCCDADDPGCFA